MAPYLVFLFLALPYLQTTTMSFGVGLPSSVSLCREEERQALLRFRGDLNDSSGRLSSWVGHECCRWRGVSCNNLTGRVAMLHLGNPYNLNARSSLSGNINPSLFSLNDLYYLNLSGNSLGKQVPNLFGKLQSLRYLDLSNNLFEGETPPSLGNLSKLNYLDLFNSYYSISHSLNWISHLSSLKYLNLGYMNLSSIGLGWLHLLPPSLLELHLPYCRIQTPLSQLTSMNLTSLLVLDLAYNDFPSIPSWICNLTHLKHLDLKFNNFTSPVSSELANLKSLEVLDLEASGMGGQVPIFIGIMCNLRELGLSYNSFVGGLDKLLNAFTNCTISRLESLDLSWNQITGSISDFIGNLSSLESLDLSSNQMNGSIPESLGQLSHLVGLYLSSNSWRGNLSESFFINLTRLKSFAISTYQPMSLFLNFSNDWIPPFKLQYVHIEDCTVGPAFGLWLQSQTELVFVSLVNIGISDSIPEEWFMKISPQIESLDLSRNQIRAKLPSFMNSPKLYHIDLSHNRFEGPLPSLFNSPKLFHIDFSHNRFEGSLPHWSSDGALVFNLENNLFSGSIPSNYDQLLPNLRELYLSENKLTGSIPLSMCNMSVLQILVLRSNHLSGKLPQKWAQWEGILVVDVADNKLSGKIPTSMGVPSSLQILNLSNNNFSGSIPLSLFQNCTNLKSIDLGDNAFTGSISLKTKQILKQSNNNCGGTIPSSLVQNCNDIDLGDNRFKGSISRLNDSYLYMLRLRSNSLSGQIPQQLCSSFPSLRIIDFGHNNFSGTIPKCLIDLSTSVQSFYTVRNYYSELFDKNIYVEKASLTVKGQELIYNTTLKLVNIIDLSSNNLEGEIPEGICGLLTLGTLNLSRNQLSGSIPANIGNMKQLETLDLSNNTISGSIPQSLSSLTFLSHLNLSFNNLSGRIPTSTQLQSIQSDSGPSIYGGNPNLCGPPLLTKCSGDGAPSSTNPGGGERDEAGDDNGRLGLYVSIVVGFTLGFWGVCGTLFVKHSWRYAYFRFFGAIKDKMALTIELKVAHFKRRKT